jgi:hypothetical protein
MTVTALKTRPEEPQQAAALIRASDSIRAEIERVAGDRQVAEARLARLELTYDHVLKTGDDAAAETHETDSAATRRAIRRADLRSAELQEQLQAAVAAEQEAETEREKQRAIEARESVRRKFQAEYIDPARRIAAFLREYQAAEIVCWNANVPTLQAELRTTPDERIAAREEEYTVYIDENGQETDHARPGGVHGVCPKTGGPIDKSGQLIPERPKRTKTRTILGSFTPGRRLHELPEVVNLPGIRIDDPDIWSAAALETKKTA